jgi:catechol 2,3-dioxygenase-like lactoylglutathione lyase family enzyme
MNELLPTLGLRQVKVIALAVQDLDRANRFYEEMLELTPAYEGDELVGWWLGSVIMMLKPDWQMPTAVPNPRITLGVDDALATQEALQAREIVIADAVSDYGGYYVGSFLDSEGNKLWFCSGGDL